jgi:hypothetical protein
MVFNFLFMSYRKSVIVIILVWSHVKRYSNNNISLSVFGMETVTRMWKEDLFSVFIGHKVEMCSAT